MKILFITAHPYLPQMYGGLQTSTDQLCQSLLERGHGVAVLSGLMPNGYFGLKSRVKMQINNLLKKQKISKDLDLNYPVWRSWYSWEVVEFVASKEKPDLIVVLAVKPVQMALAAKPTGIPTVLLLQDVEFSQHGGDFKNLGKISCIANSYFTANKYRVAYGVDPIVINPFINPDDYKTTTTRKNVTFINPHLKKGLNIAIEIARRCNDIPFSFVETWPLSTQEKSELTSKISTVQNVKLVPTQKDMRNIYNKCRVLLAPSTWEEGYGRVVTEAQISGIPVVTSSQGGLPEAAGKGGIVIDIDKPIEEWVNAIRKLWDDTEYYDRMSDAAIIHASRDEVNLTFQVDKYEKAFLSACNPQS